MSTYGIDPFSDGFLTVLKYMETIELSDLSFTLSWFLSDLRMGELAWEESIV